MKRVLDWADPTIVALVLACFGATLQCLRGPWRGWKNFIVSNAMAAFSAVVAMSILPQYMPYEVAAGVTGIIGYSGGTLVDALLERIKREIETKEFIKHD